MKLKIILNKTLAVLLSVILLYSSVPLNAQSDVWLSNADPKPRLKNPFFDDRHTTLSIPIDTFHSDKIDSLPYNNIDGRHLTYLGSEDNKILYETDNLRYYEVNASVWQKYHQAREKYLNNIVNNWDYNEENSDYTIYARFDHYDKLSLWKRINHAGQYLTETQRKKFIMDTYRNPHWKAYFNTIKDWKTSKYIKLTPQKLADLMKKRGKSIAKLMQENPRYQKALRDKRNQEIGSQIVAGIATVALLFASIYTCGAALGPGSGMAIAWFGGSAATTAITISSVNITKTVAVVLLLEIVSEYGSNIVADLYEDLTDRFIQYNTLNNNEYTQQILNNIRKVVYNDETLNYKSIRQPTYEEQEDLIKLKAKLSDEIKDSLTDIENNGKMPEREKIEYPKYPPIAHDFTAPADKLRVQKPLPMRYPQSPLSLQQIPLDWIDAESHKQALIRMHGFDVIEAELQYSTDKIKYDLALLDIINLLRDDDNICFDGEDYSCKPSSIALSHNGRLMWRTPELKKALNAIYEIDTSKPKAIQKNPGYYIPPLSRTYQ